MTYTLLTISDLGVVCGSAFKTIELAKDARSIALYGLTVVERERAIEHWNFEKNIADEALRVEMQQWEALNPYHDPENSHETAIVQSFLQRNKDAGWGYAVPFGQHSRSAEVSAEGLIRWRPHHWNSHALRPTWPDCKTGIRLARIIGPEGGVFVIDAVPSGKHT